MWATASWRRERSSRIRTASISPSGLVTIQHDPQVVPANAITITISEVLAAHESATKSYSRNLGITSLAKSSIERNTLECSMLPKDMLAPKYPMPCSSLNLAIRCTHCSGVPK